MIRTWHKRVVGTHSFSTIGAPCIPVDTPPGYAALTRHIGAQGMSVVFLALSVALGASAFVNWSA